MLLKAYEPRCRLPSRPTLTANRDVLYWDGSTG